MTRWARQLLRSLAATGNIHHRDNHGCTSLSGRSLRIDHAPGGIFDPQFTDISANAAGRDRPPPASAMVLVSTVRRISSNRGRLAVVGLIASTDKP